jgi:uncharacterized protein YyaL (SSP411 family)
MREMRHPKGAFYAALDADSDGEEGKYYLWRRDRVKRLLDDDEYLVIETLYGLDKPANFEGKWNLHRYDAWRSVVSRLSLDPERAAQLLASGRAKLLAEREQRTRPGRDDKLLTGWNGLAIKGLAKAGARLAREDWLDAASQCAHFLRQQLWRDGILQATWQEGPRHGPFLDDYAFTLDGLLTLLEQRFDDDLYAFALALADGLLREFTDAAGGGFFFTGAHGEALITRQKPTMDEAVPAGNGVALDALYRLGHLAAEPTYLDAAAATADWALGAVAQYPAGHGTLLRAMAAAGPAFTQIILRGDSGQLAAFEEVLAAVPASDRVCYRIPWTSRRLPDYLQDPGARSGGIAYLCRGTQCSAPMTDPAQLRAALSRR